MKIGSKLAIILLSLVFLGHLGRLVFRIELVIEHAIMPMWLSAVAAVLSGAAVSLLWRESHSGR